MKSSAKKPTTKEKVELMKLVYNEVMTEEIGDLQIVGPDLAYLLGAILNGYCCEWPEGGYYGSGFLRGTCFGITST